MSGSEMGSVSVWLDHLRAGDTTAAGPLWDRYGRRLTRLAGAVRRRLAGATASAEADSEDAALSAFDSFCAGATRGRFPDLDDRDDLWRLLAVITARKTRAQARRAGARRRGGAGTAPGTGTKTAAGAGGIASVGVVSRAVAEPLDPDQLAGHEPDPHFAAEVGEAFANLLDRLGDDDLRRVALDRLDGYTNDEIADRLGCARRTVARRLDLIRRIWVDAVR